MGEKVAERGARLRAYRADKARLDFLARWLRGKGLRTLSYGGSPRSYLLKDDFTECVVFGRDLRAVITHVMERMA